MCVCISKDRSTVDALGTLERRWRDNDRYHVVQLRHCGNLWSKYTENSMYILQAFSGGFEQEKNSVTEYMLSCYPLLEKCTCIYGTNKMEWREGGWGNVIKLF